MEKIKWTRLLQTWKITSIMKKLFAVWLISFFIIEGLILHAAYLKEQHEVDYIVVLGAGVRGEKLSPILRYRLDKSLQYLNEHPVTKVVVSGGQGPNEDISEAEAMQKYLVANGIAEQRVIVENKSTTTYQNLLFSKRILAQMGAADKEILIVTSDFHIFRSTLLASRLGFVSYGLPADSVTVSKPYYYLREYFVLLKSFVWDR